MGRGDGNQFSGWQYACPHPGSHACSGPGPPAPCGRRRRPLESVAVAAAAQPRVLLQLENLTAGGRANSYDVYGNISAGEEPTQHPEPFAGRLDLSGVAEASRATAQHPGSGLTYTLDISSIYHELSTAADWDPQHIDVSLVPVRKWAGATVTVGRVSLFFT